MSVGAHDAAEGHNDEDQLTCGINTNMCAALLHVISDLGRSITTLIESTQVSVVVVATLQVLRAWAITSVDILWLVKLSG